MTRQLVTCLVGVALITGATPIAATDLVVDGMVESSASGFRFPDGSTQLTAAQGPRSFYLTSATVQGDAPLFACATGYHMAALWELLRSSLVEYEASHAEAAIPTADMGAGPPFGVKGWVRTGGPASGLAFPGVANCQAWQSNAGATGGDTRGGGDSGSVVGLADRWDDVPTVISPWEAGADSCSSPRPVWCVAD